jgi:hypothetical protein
MPWPSPQNSILGIPSYAQSPLNSINPGTITSQAYWTWQGTSTNNPYVQYYFNNSPTKTGLLPSDLKDFVGVPVVINTLDGAVPTPVPDTRLFQLIRQAEDWVETETGILLAQAWVASPPLSPQGAASCQMSITNPASGQIYGVDYDILDPGYDFFYRRFLMEGWGVQQLRYRPLKTVINYAFIYPLLSEFFNIPRSWLVEDWDAAIIRVVPSANVQMLPLFAMQLAFMGFAQSLPQGLYMQYIAGLNSVDYNTRFAFMKLLVLSAAAVYLLPILQGSVNFGQTRRATSVDGLRYDVGYSATGAAYIGLINQFTTQRDTLLRTAIDLVRGVVAFISL